MLYRFIQDSIVGWQNTHQLIKLYTNVDTRKQIYAALSVQLYTDPQSLSYILVLVYKCYDRGNLVIPSFIVGEASF